MKSTTIIAHIVQFIASVFLTLTIDARQAALSDSESHTKEYLKRYPYEIMFLHVDRDKYIAGEDIWFSIYNINSETGRLSTQSVIAYIELLNPWNTPVIQKRFQLSDGRGEGNFTLPDSINSGTYTIRAYTNPMKDFLAVYCFMYDIEIFNPFHNSGFIRKTGSANLMLTKESVEKEKKSAVTLSADSITGRREKVSLKLKNMSYGQSEIINFSVSVTPLKASGSSPGINEYFGERLTGWNDKLSGIKNNPADKIESSGHNLSVKIKYREGNTTDSSKFLYMSIQGKVAGFNYASMDSSGNYTFLLPVENNLRNLIIQPEHGNKNMILEIEPSFSRIMPETGNVSDSLTSFQTGVFSDLSFNYQAAKIYGIKSKKEVAPEIEGTTRKRRFYGIPEMEIKLDDYISLPTMQEVFYELIPGVILRSGKQGFEMKITNPLTGVYYYEPPLVMIDGVIINDLTVLVDLNPETVEKVEVVKTPYLVGDLVLHGIVNVITRSGNFSNVIMPEYAVILPYRVIESKTIPTFPDYSDRKNLNNRTPDLRNTLYWNPSVKTGKDGEAEIEFWTSDLPGIYIINLQGISESGKMISVKKSLTVR